MFNGRIGVYIHSDSITENKGACIVRVTTNTDFASRTINFKTFVNDLAKLAYAAQSQDWNDIIKEFPELEENKNNLENSLKEKIIVDSITILTL